MHRSQLQPIPLWQSTQCLHTAVQLKSPPEVCAHMLIWLQLHICSQRVFSAISLRRMSRTWKETKVNPTRLGKREPTLQGDNPDQQELRWYPLQPQLWDHVQRSENQPYCTPSLPPRQTQEHIRSPLPIEWTGNSRLLTWSLWAVMQ